MYYIAQLGSKIVVRKVVMLWIRTLVSSSYCGNAVGRSTNFQKSVVWPSPQSVISSEEILECIGKKAEEIIPLIKGIKCGFKPTSCPDQLANALQEALNEQN